MTRPVEVTAATKSEAMRVAVVSGLREQTRDTSRLVVVAGPEPVSGPDGTVVGIQVWARLFEGDREVRIDQHRVFINPPTQLVLAEKTDDTERVTKDDPEAAFWNILWDSVLSTPNPRGRRKL